MPCKIVGGTKVPRNERCRERKFPGTFVPREGKFPRTKGSGNENSRELSFPGNESSRNEKSRERKFPMDYSFLGTKGIGHEKSRYRSFCRISLRWLLGKLYTTERAKGHAAKIILCARARPILSRSQCHEYLMRTRYFFLHVAIAVPSRGSVVRTMLLPQDFANLTGANSGFVTR